jgi:hemolysin III
VVWGLALLGVVLEAVARQQVRVFSLVLYLALGWVAAIAVKPILESVGTGGIVLLLLGGFAYTGGVIFYSWERLPYNHAVWHVCVMIGSIFHFFAVLFYVIPGKGA